MNIEVANRLVDFRKKNGLSQEQLAEKIGVSRQAVSKWERSEASPDTDNLILLARLYNVSLDDLLKTDDEIPMPEEEQPSDASGFDAGEPEQEESSGKGFRFDHGIHVEDDNGTVHIGPGGIHVENAKDHVHIGWDGIHVNDGKDVVSVDKNGVFVNGERKDEWEWCEKKNMWKSFPYPILTIIAFLLIGFLLNGWWWGWLVFLTVPVFFGTVAAIQKRKLSKFPYEVVTVIAYLCMGMFANLWHPGWVIFLSIPLFRWICSLFKHRKTKVSFDNGEFRCHSSDEDEDDD